MILVGDMGVPRKLNLNFQIDPAGMPFKLNASVACRNHRRSRSIFPHRLGQKSEDKADSFWIDGSSPVRIPVLRQIEQIDQRLSSWPQPHRFLIVFKFKLDDNLTFRDADFGPLSLLEPCWHERVPLPGLCTRQPINITNASADIALCQQASVWHRGVPRPYA